LAALGWVVWFATALLVVLGIAWWVRRTGEIVAPLPICLGTVGYVLPRAAYLLWFGRAPLTSGGLTPDAQTSLIVTTVLAIAAFVMGALVGSTRPSAIRVGAAIRFSVPDPEFARARWVAAAAGAAGGVVLLYMFSSLGNISYALSHQYEMNTLLQGKQSTFQLTRLTVAAVMLLLIDPASHKSRVWVWALSLALAAIFIPFGYRVYIVLPIALPIGLYHLTVRPIRLRWMIPGALLGATMLLGMVYIRLLSVRRLEQATAIFSNSPVTAAHFAFNSTGELKIFDAATIILRDVPEFWPYNYGKTFLRAPWMAVPRRLWPEKPYTAGHVIVARYLPTLRTAYSPTIVGELFLAAGWVGLVLGSFVVGWICRVAWEWRVRHAGVGNASLYLLFCYFVFYVTRVGDLSAALWFFIPGAVMTVGAFALSSGGRHSYGTPQTSGV
jgi:hypothetical protein